MSSNSSNNLLPPAILPTLEKVSDVLYMVVCVIIVISNLLVILCFAFTRKLRTVQNYIIISLTLTDFMLGAVVYPITRFQVSVFITLLLRRFSR